MDVRSCCLSLLFLLAVSWGGKGLEKRHATRGRIRSLFEERHPELAMEKQKHSLVEEVVQQVSDTLLEANNFIVSWVCLLFDC